MSEYDFKPPTYWEMFRHSGWKLVLVTAVQLALITSGVILIGREFHKLQTELEALKKVCPAHDP